MCVRFKGNYLSLADATGGGGVRDGSPLDDDDGDAIHETVYNIAPVSSVVNGEFKPGPHLGKDPST